MWRIWLLFDPRRALIGLAVFLFTLAIVIHFVLLSTNRYNWIEGPRMIAPVTVPATSANELEESTAAPLSLAG